MSFVVELSPATEADLDRLFDFLLDRAGTTEEIVSPSNVVSLAVRYQLEQDCH